MTMIELLAPIICMGLLVASAAGVMGVFIVWGKMAYFGETLAHGALMGLGLSFVFSFSPLLSIWFTVLLVALFIVLLQRSQSISSDTLLGIISHGTLALGLVMISLSDKASSNYTQILFGDLLSASWRDIYILIPFLLVVFIALSKIANQQLLIILSEELAYAEGVPVQKIKLIFTCLLALVVSIGIQYVGVLLMTSLLIVPAAAARQISNSVAVMVLLSIAVSIISTLAGVYVSYQYNLYLGPSIVLVACSIFIVNFTLARLGQVQK